MSMELIPGQVILDTALTSNVVESPPAAWAGGTSYGLGVQSSLFTGTMADVYESLVAGNLGNDPASSPTFWKFIGVAYKDWSSVTAYAGTETVTRGHKLYDAVAASTNQDPATDATGTYWKAKSASNRWMMFDSQTGSQTSRPGDIVVEIAVTGRADSVILQNVDAASVNVTVLDGVTEVYNQNFTMVSEAGILDYFDYCFAPIVRLTDLYVAELPNAYNPTIVITISSGDDAVEAKVGNCLIGLMEELGETQFGMDVGFTDWSVKKEDGFGGWYIAKRPWTKDNKFRAWLPREQVDRAYNRLTSFSATPVGLVASRDYACTFGVGLISARISINYATESILTIDFKGL